MKLTEFAVNVVKPSGIDPAEEPYAYIAYRGINEAGEQIANYMKVPDENIGEFVQQLCAKSI
jgi:hypothetical protein